MANLEDVVQQLKVQQDSLGDVGKAINKLVDFEQERVLDQKNKELDEKERRIEQKNQSRSRTSSQQSSPTSFSQGILQGTGIAGLGEMTRGLIPSFAGALGGATLGGLFGKFIGRGILAGAGILFGQRYLDRTIDQFTKALDIDNINLFGEDYDTSKVISGVTGALAAVFGPSIIAGQLKRLFGSSDFKNKTGQGGGPRGSRGFIPGAALATSFIVAGQMFGDEIAKAIGSPEMADSISTAMTAVGAAAFFSPKLGIVAGLAAVAIYASDQLSKFVQSKIDETYNKVDNIVDKSGNLSAEQLTNMSDARLIQTAKDLSLAEYRLERLINEGGLSDQKLILAQEKMDAIKATQANLPISAINSPNSVNAKMESAISGNQTHLNELVNAYLSSNQVDGDMDKLLALARREGTAYAVRALKMGREESIKFGDAYAEKVKSQAQMLFRSGSEFNNTAGAYSRQLDPLRKNLNNLIHGESRIVNPGMSAENLGPTLPNNQPIIINNDNSVTTSAPDSSGKGPEKGTLPVPPSTDRSFIDMMMHLFKKGSGSIIDLY